MTTHAMRLHNGAICLRSIMFVRRCLQMESVFVKS